MELSNNLSAVGRQEYHSGVLRQQSAHAPRTNAHARSLSRERLIEPIENSSILPIETKLSSLRRGNEKQGRRKIEALSHSRARGMEKEPIKAGSSTPLSQTRH